MKDGSVACDGLRVNQDVNRKEMGTAVSISVVCYRYKRLANGESPLMLRVSKDGKRSMRSLGVSVDAKQWDFRKNEPKLRCPNREYILDIILKAKQKTSKLHESLLAWKPFGIFAEQ